MSANKSIVDHKEALSIPQHHLRQDHSRKQREVDGEVESLDKFYSKKVKSSFEPDQTLTTRKRRLNDATLQSHSCVTCGATFQSSDDLLDHLSGSEQQDGSGSTMSRCSIRHCFMCGFVPAPDVCLDDRRRCLQDHIITEHFKVHIHQFTLALQWLGTRNYQRIIGIQTEREKSIVFYQVELVLFQLNLW